MDSSPSDPRRDLTADPDDPAAAACYKAELRRRGSADHFAVIACIHGNLEALEAVFADIDRREIPRVVCLGDMVGIGPNPVECVDLVFERCDWSLRGHYEDALVKDVIWSATRALKTLEWSRDLLRPRVMYGTRKSARWRRLTSLPERWKEGDREFVHGSPRDPVVDYLHPCCFGEYDKLQECLDSISHVLFCGHSHMPFAVVREIDGEQELVEIEAVDGATFELSPTRKAIVNVGSVGKPRDRDARACYVEVCEEVVTWHRIEYDVEETIRRMHAVPQIDRRLAESLRAGL